MKKKYIVLASALAIAASFFAVSSIRSNSVNAASSVGVDVTDASESYLRSYYSSASGKNGSALISSLRSITMNTHVALSGDSAVWNAYKITDRDWAQSPLSSSELASYDKFNNSGDNPYVHILYRNDNGLPTAAHANDTHGTYIDREHVWAKSHGNFEWNAPAGIDLHHLMPGDSDQNQQAHNNYDYGDVDKSRPYSSFGTAEKHNNTGIRGYPVGITNKQVFEPYAQDKGNIARACFYMAARYSQYGGKAGEPYLKLIDQPSGTATVTSSATVPGEMGMLQTLLKWHHEDPVDDFEIHRNNLIDNNYQHNRNPFIDFPDWADKCFGSDSTAANAATDTVSKIGGAKTITSVDFDFSGITKEYRTSEKFVVSGGSARVIYSDGTDRTVSGDSISFSPYQNDYRFLSSDVGTHLITASLYGFSSTFSITVSQGAPTKTFEKTSSISIGDKVCFVCEDVSQEMASFSTTSSKYVIGESYLNTIGGLLEFTVEQGYQAGTYSFKTGSYYLSSSGSSNLTNASLPSPNENASFTVEFADGNAFVHRAADATKTIFYNKSNPRFSMYSRTTASTDYPAIQIYKETVADEIVLNESSITLNVGEQSTLSYSSSGPSVVSWSSSDSSVATVDNGEVTAVSSGTATITVRKGSASDSCAVTVSSPTPAGDSMFVFSKLESVETDYSGEYIIGCPEMNTIFDTHLTTVDAANTAVDVTFVGGAIPYCTSLKDYTVTLAKKDGGYSVKLASGLYIGHNSNKNNIASSSSDIYTNTVENDGVNGLVIKSSDGYFLRYNSASDQKRFRFYSSTGSVKTAFLYRFEGNEVSASDSGECASFKASFQSSLGGICHLDGNTDLASLTAAWGSLKEDFKALPYVSQAIFLKADDSCSSLYDYVASKYGFADFASRKDNPNSHITAAGIQNGFKETSNPEIALALALGCTGLGLFAFVIIKHKKRENA